VLGDSSYPNRKTEPLSRFELPHSPTLRKEMHFEVRTLQTQLNWKLSDARREAAA